MSMIDLKRIELSVDCKNPEEAIKMAGKLLLYDDFIKESYIKGAIENFRKNGAYFVIAPGIAIPHSRPEDGVNKTGISLVVLKNPLEFGNKINDPVKIIIFLATKGNDEHVKYISRLARIFGEEENISIILNAKLKKEIIQIFE
ncbi:PTS sugar transporter subunit IIA [Clostridium oceanicum]|uniref:PTS sugar transporter subunit IIA n=1 Tax=Clostridium oceanicum TaxID=1543 RepID=A0ABN1J9B4_9CLOT